MGCHLVLLDVAVDMLLAIRLRLCVCVCVCVLFRWKRGLGFCRLDFRGNLNSTVEIFIYSTIYAEGMLCWYIIFAKLPNCPSFCLYQWGSSPPHALFWIVNVYSSYYFIFVIITFFFLDLNLLSYF